MIVSDVITRVRRTFGDEAAVQVQDADVIRWINDGQIEIVKQNDSALQKTSFVNLVANQTTYTLPTDLLLLRSLRYKFTDMFSFKRLQYMSVQQFDETIDGWDGTAFGTGGPQFYTMDDGSVLLFPTPDQASTSGLKIRYNQKPTDVVNTGSALALPAIYHPTLVQYCMWQASLLDEDHEPGVMYQGNFQQSIDLLKDRENKANTDTYPVITIRDEDI